MFNPKKYNGVHLYTLFTSILKGGPSPAGGGHFTEEWPSDASLFQSRGLALSPYLWIEKQQFQEVKGDRQ